MRAAAEHVLAVTETHLANIYNGTGVSGPDGIKHIHAALVLARSVIPEQCGETATVKAIGGPLSARCTKEPHQTGMHYDKRSGRRFS